MRLFDFMRSQLREFTFLGPDGKFVREPEYPEFVWQEAIVNALVHRAYSFSNAPIFIEMFDDRLEIKSPGDYPPGVHPREFIHNPRNPRLMDGMRYLRFVRMISEGSLRMREEMQRANLPAPEFSLPGKGAVRVVLRNDIERRLKERTGESKGIDEFTNLFRITWTPDNEADLSELGQAPRLGEVKATLLSALRAHGYVIESFASERAIDPQVDCDVPELRGTKLVSIHPGFAFRLLSLADGIYLILDHDIQVRNRASLDRILSLLPSTRTRRFRNAFLRQEGRWRPCRIRALAQETASVELVGEREILEVPQNQVVPNLPTTWISELLQRVGVEFDLHKTIKRLALNLSNDAPRQRAQKTEEIARNLAAAFFPLRVRRFQLKLDPVPQQLKSPCLMLKSDLLDARAVFSRQTEQSSGTILNGLSTYGSYEKPERAVPLVLLSTQDKTQEMTSLVDQLRRGSAKFRGIEKTFAISFDEIIPETVGSPEEYLARCKQISATVPQNSFFLVYCPEHGYSRADYQAPYYQVKHFLLEAGFASQMVDETTLGNPSWKDYNLALDIFAKAGHVPWVLAEGLPNADLFLGLSYSTIPSADGRVRIIGYVNVFDRYGKWLYYKGNTKPITFEERNSALGELLNQVVCDYEQKAKLQRLHVHHGFRLSHEGRLEIAASVHSVAPDAEVSFVHINEYPHIRLYDRSPKGDGSLTRGGYVVLAPNRFVISTTGRNEFGQRGMGTPKPLDVTVNRRHSKEDLDVKLYAQHVLSLTRLNWASTKDFCRVPITLKFAGDIAYLMNVFLASFGSFRLHQRLERTPWFL